MEVITLGVAAGPAIRSDENGICTAVVVNGSFYIVDFGLGCTRASHEAGLRGQNFRAGFITHLHSDHVAELPGFLMWNWGKPVQGFEQKVRLIGPGPDPRLKEHDLQGTSGLIEGVQRAFSYDLHIRVADEHRPPLEELIETQDLSIPASGEAGIFPVYEDENVRVSAVLVDHPPVFPAVAYRFDDINGGSVVISGDTAESSALASLATECDLLIHEAVNLSYYEARAFDPAFVAHQANSHTSPEGAGRVASQARARHLVLSHLAGQATDEFWKAGASSTYTGPVSVARSGQHFTVTS